MKKTIEKQMPQLMPLTGLRFMAAVLVVMFHFLDLRATQPAGPLHAASKAAHNIIASGFSGVSFFFILSGFILAYNYLTPRGALRVSRRAFWLARGARIYPIYLLALAFAALPFLQSGRHGPSPCTGHHPVVTGLASLTLVQAWLPCSASVWNPPSWSLSAEAFFYLLFPLMAFALTRLTRRRLVMAVIAVWAALLAVALAYIIIAPDGAGTPGPWYDRFWLKALYMNPLARLPEFLLGAVLGTLFLNRTARQTGPARTRSLHVALLSIAALLGIIVVFSLGPLPMVLLNQVILDPLFALLIYTLAFGVGPLAAFFALPLMRRLGEASYALYILHWPTWGWLNQALRPVLPYFTASRLFFAVYLCVAIGLAVLSLRFVEQPARRAIRRAFAPREAHGHV